MLIAIAAMFLQQTCGSIARALPAVLAPLIIAELHVAAALVGIYFSLTAFAGLIGQLGSGGLIIRHGAIRMSHLALLFTGAGLAAAVLGGAVGLVLSALIGNGVAAVATPASSQLLGRWSIKRYAPFSFSIAQCATPAGILLTGYLAPVTAHSFGWRDTMLGSAALCWAVALMLQPLRSRLDTDPSPRYPISLSDLQHHNHRRAGGPGAALPVVRPFCVQRHAGCICCLFRYLHDRTRISAGRGWIALFDRHCCGIAGPHFMGLGWWLYVALNVVLGGLSVGIAVSIGLLGAVTPHWPLLVTGAVAMVVSATAMSWHGITLSDAARLAPPEQVGAVTGGVLSFGQIGALACPAVFSLLLRLTGAIAPVGWPAPCRQFWSASACCARVSLRSGVMRCDLHPAVVTVSPDSILAGLPSSPNGFLPRARLNPET